MPTRNHHHYHRHPDDHHNDQGSPGAEERRQPPGHTVTSIHPGHAAVKQVGRDRVVVSQHLQWQWVVNTWRVDVLYPGVEQPFGKFFGGAVGAFKAAPANNRLDCQEDYIEHLYSVQCTCTVYKYSVLVKCTV